MEMFEEKIKVWNYQQVLKFKKMIVAKFNVNQKIWPSGDESNSIDLVY